MPRPNRGEWRGAQDSRIRTGPATIANHAGRRPPSQIASKRQGRPKSFGLWYPAKNLGIPLRTWEQAEAAHARVTATSISFPSPLRWLSFHNRLAQSAMADVRTLSGKPDERFAQKR